MLIGMSGWECAWSSPPFTTLKTAVPCPYVLQSQTTASVCKRYISHSSCILCRNACLTLFENTYATSQRHGRVSLQSPEPCCYIWKMWAERQGIKHTKGKKMLGTKIFTLKILASKQLEKFWVAFLTDFTAMPSPKSSSPQEAVLIQWLQNCFRSFN